MSEKLPSKEYFFNILNTVYPEYLQGLMNHAAKQRYSEEGKAQKKEVIEATDEMYDMLNSMPF